MVTFFAAYCLFLSWSFWFQNVDDAYISFRYGKNLMEGKGLIYNEGEYVEGYTNFLWTIMTAPLTQVPGIDISKFTLTIGLLISIVNIFVLLQISRQFLDLYSTHTKLFIFLPALFFVLDDSVAFWAIGGMEFPLYTLFILGVIYYYFTINEKDRNHVILSVFLIMVTLTRPEGNMIFALTILHMFINRKEIRNFPSRFAFMVISYSIFLVIYYGFKYFYYGQLLPNTFYAKGVTDISMNLLLGLKYLILCVGSRIYLLGFMLFIPLRQAFRDFKQSYLLLFAFVYMLYLVGVGGDWMFANRFFVPITPILFILSSIGISEVVGKLESVSGSKKRNYAVPLVAVICVMLFGVTLAFLEYKQLIIKDENYRYEMQWSKFGQWLKKNVSPETIIAVGPAGKIPYYSELYTIDMWGLNNSHIAKTESKRPQSGHKKYDFEHVLSMNPEFIIGYAGFTDADIPPQYEKFNAPEEEFKSIDVVFRLKPEYRNKN